MASLFGTLFILTLGTWLLRERRAARRTRAAAAILDGLAAGREPDTAALAACPPGLVGKISLIRQEVHHSRRQRQLAEANLQIILSSMQEGVLVADSKRTVRLVNPSARRLFNISDEIFGTPVLEALHEPAVDEMILTALQSGASQEREIEVGGRPPLMLAVRVAPMRDAAGEAGALVMFRDITRLIQLEKMRREFVANVSHELRTPLAIFQGYVENLQDCPQMPRDEQAEVFAVLAKHSKRLNALVEDLLVLARLEARSTELEFHPIEITPFFHELARDWAIRMEQSGVHLRIAASPGLPPIHADRLRIEQVFTNLLDNALKYTPRGGEITLGAKTAPGAVELWVADTGQGILSTDLPHIFERFYRADKARSRELGGTGLGLSIVKHIAHAHGGSVSAESTYGKGTTIRITLPTAPAPTR